MKNIQDIINGLEEVDNHFIKKTYFPTMKLRVNLRNTIDFLKVYEAENNEKIAKIKPISLSKQP